MAERVKPNMKGPYNKIFFGNFVGGIGWALGMTIGFTFVVYLLTRILSTLGGLPYIGSIFADIINSVNNALNTSPLKN